MPCRTDYLEPNQREVELQRAARLLVYLWEQTGKNLEAWAVSESTNVYARDERSVTELCAALRAMDSKQRDTIIYNAHDKDARDLATWWEEHQAADAAREEQEAAEREQQTLREQALDKLSDEERKALGL